MLPRALTLSSLALLALAGCACLPACAGKDSDTREAPTDTGSDTSGDTSGESGGETSGDTSGDTSGETGGDTSGDTGSSPCVGLAPVASPAANRGAIEACLAAGSVSLAAGRFEIDRGIALPAGATLTGAGAGATTLALTDGTSGFLVYLWGDATVADVALDGQDTLEFSYTNSIVLLLGSNNRVSRAWIGNSAGTHRGAHTVGVYFVDPAGTGNVVEDSELYGTFYGTIFVAGLPAGSGNRFTGNTVHGIQCDSVTLVGYGEVDGNTIYENGWDCENGPIPGGGVYSLWNTTGARITNNEIHDNCGHGVDLDGVANFVIDGNTVYDPGYTWGGGIPWCGGASGFGFMDVSSSTVTNNVVDNHDRPWNAQNTNPVFAARGAASWSDLPGGSTGIMAAFFAVRPTSAGMGIGNVVDGNVFRASCSSGCVGTGYVFTRGTGYDAAGGWSAATTNYVTANDPYGSNVGSVRCGGNWYAANVTCPGDPTCNVDDAQHTYDWSRNDGCYTY